LPYWRPCPSSFGSQRLGLLAGSSTRDSAVDRSVDWIIDHRLRVPRTVRTRSVLRALPGCRQRSHRQVWSPLPCRRLSGRRIHLHRCHPTSPRRSRPPPRRHSLLRQQRDRQAVISLVLSQACSTQQRVAQSRHHRLHRQRPTRRRALARQRPQGPLHCPGQPLVRSGGCCTAPRVPHPSGIESPPRPTSPVPTPGTSDSGGPTNAPTTAALVQNSSAGGALGHAMTRACGQLRRKRRTLMGECRLSPQAQVLSF